MKNSILLFLSCISANLIFSQAPAGDWTKTDCSGLEHNLFTELDSGYAAIIEFVMVPDCAPCINAANGLDPIIEHYNALYDNRVRLYSMGFNDSYTCELMDGWKADNHLRQRSLFIDGTEELAYYGGFGMPTIVIVGRDTHQLWYQKMGFSLADTINISQGIEYALGVSDPVLEINEISLSQPVNVFPDPARDEIYLNPSPAPGSQLTIFSQTGQKIRDLDQHNGKISVGDLPSGFYLLRICSADGVGTARFFKQ